MKILLAVDNSLYSQKLRDFLNTHESWLSSGNEYTVFTVIGGYPGVAAAHEMHSSAQQRHDAQAESTFALFRQMFEARGIHATYRHAVGFPGPAIADYATSQGCDLVMMGSHGHSAVANLLLGSVTTQVLSKCKVPALIVR